MEQSSESANRVGSAVGYCVREKETGAVSDETHDVAS